MKTFTYTGYRTEGQSVRGLVEALNRKDAREKLVHQGIFAGDIHPAEAAGGLGSYFVQTGLSTPVRAQLFREWALMLGSGHSLNQSLELLLEAPEFKKNWASLAQVRDRVREGGTLSDALSKIANDWRPFEQALIQVGEKTGQLSESLLAVADYLDSDLILREKTLTAILYPLLVLGVAVLIIGISCTWLLPSFQTTLQEAGLDIPSWTQWIILMGRWGSFLVLTASLLILLTHRYLRSQLTQKNELLVKIENLTKAVPGLKIYFETLYIQRFCQAMAMLLKSGIPLPEACSLSAEASGSRLIREQGTWMARQIQDGNSLSHTVRNISWLQNGLPGWLRAGEESGALSMVLQQAGERAARRTNRIRERFFRLLEPVLIAVIGLFVMALSFGLLSPILSMNKLLSQ